MRTVLVVGLGLFVALAAAVPSNASAGANPRVYCLNDSGDRYIDKSKPGRCAAYGPGGTFGGGVFLKRIRWRDWGDGVARGKAIECGFHLPCADIPVRVRAFRVRSRCGGGKAYTRLRAKSRHGRTVVRLPRCSRPA